MIWLGAIVALFLAAFPGASVLRWQYQEATRTRCQSNERRLATALLLYSQDHDGRLPPPEYRTAAGEWRHWLGILQPYVNQEPITTCPIIDSRGAVEVGGRYPYPFGYALSERFYGVFSAGPFPLENLELASQTVMVVESGGFRDPSRKGFESGLWSAPIYTDTALWPRAYPSQHDGRMNVAAADGHVVSLKIAHYHNAGHDALYGRMGGTIYNWNGGHPNADTGGPPRE